MGKEQKELARHVVDKFQALLDNETKDSIGEHNFEDLNSLICDALSEHSESIIERLENVIKQIRLELERRPLEL